MTARKKARKKPRKPRKDYPLFAHASGQWAKKVNQKLYYFGPWDDPDSALERWLEQKDHLIAGATPPANGNGKYTVGDAANAWLEAKHRKLKRGKLEDLTYGSYERICRTVIDQLGRTTKLEGLTNAHFAKLVDHMVDRYPSALGRGPRLSQIRSIFKHAIQEGLVTRIDYGPDWEMPSSKEMLQAMDAKDRLYTPEQLRAVIAEACPTVSVMFHLGINAALGNSDVAKLPLKAIDLKTGWTNYSRRKTGKRRRFRLWPETLAAIDTMMKCRPEPESEDVAKLLLVNPRGESYDDGKGSRIGRAVDPVLADAGVDRTFYDLRRTFITVADNLVRDRDAITHITGHQDDKNDMLARYRQSIADERLDAVTDAVRKWLFGKRKPR